MDGPQSVVVAHCLDAGAVADESIGGHTTMLSAVNTAVSESFVISCIEKEMLAHEADEVESISVNSFCLITHANGSFRLRLVIQRLRYPRAHVHYNGPPPARQTRPCVGNLGEARESS